MSTVLKPWVASMPWKMQSVLFSGLRGPDMHYDPAFKRIVKWLRAVTQNDADSTTDYMKVEPLPTWDDVRRGIEYSVTVHYFGHLLHAMQIVAAYCPDSDMSAQAARMYLDMCDLLHLHPENLIEMDRRLADKTKHE